MAAHPAASVGEHPLSILQPQIDSPAGGGCNTAALMKPAIDLTIGYLSACDGICGRDRHLGASMLTGSDFTLQCPTH
jgi:hypothetical protein